MYVYLVCLLLQQTSPEVSVGSLPLDRQYKVTVEALNSGGEVTTALTLLLYTGSFHVGRCTNPITPTVVARTNSNIFIVPRVTK